ncbi:MAG TPA: NAD(P)/FAD-dependent oxidoreductase [Planctomycetota bacterium]|nr:NAD(P)/FAD-dependent oxidoreductase [Planctomycetota bacterium]
MRGAARRFDCVVIGSGVNGLAAATTLARADRRVLVCEAGEHLGGSCAAEEFHPGYRTTGVVHDAALLRPWVTRALDLERHGLVLRKAPASTYLAGRDGAGLSLHSDPDRTREEIAAHSARDAERYGSWREFVERFTPLVQRLLDGPPIDPFDTRPGELTALAGAGLALRLLGGRDMTELLRILPMSLSDWLGEWFETDLLAAGIAAPGLEGTWMGPRSAGSVFAWFTQECSRGPEAAGGPAAVVRALLSAANAAGVECWTETEVSRVCVERASVRAVELSDGQRVECDTVAAACGPRRALLDLLSPTALNPDQAAAASSIRCRGAIAKLDVALDGPLELAARPGLAVERVCTAEGLDALERAFDALKYDRASERPWLDVRVPSRADPSLAPPGHHVLSILVHNAPTRVEGGWTDERRTQLEALALDALAAHAPELSARKVATRLTTPDQLAERQRLDGGHLYQAERALDQSLFLRPTDCCGRYATPVAGLFLCGSGSHPGGPVSGAPGVLAARAMLAAPQG